MPASHTDSDALRGAAIMTLTLRAVSLNDLPLTQPITAHFDLQGGTIGRADDNTLALPDPERYISRQQASITAGRVGYVIRNIGGANPVIVRNQALGQGESAPLAHSDQVRIGGYLLEVIDDEAALGDATRVTRGRAAAEPKPEARADGRGMASLLDPRGGALPSSNPFADLLNTPAPAPAAQLPPDFDFFESPAPARHATPTLPDDPFADLIPPEPGASVNSLLEPDRGDDPLLNFMNEAMAPAIAPRPALPPEISPDHTPQRHAAFVPPRPVARSAPVAPAPPPVQPPAFAPAPEGASASASTDADALWRAFCEGAGIRLPLPQGLSPELMRIMGLVLRSAVDGTLQLIAVRRETRNELRPTDVTVIKPRENNPLKFSPDAQSALEQLLQPPMRGFLAGPVAMTDAMNDLVSHAIGGMAGTRAALEGVLARFEPGELEAKLAGKSVLDSVLPMNRKAKLWELYLQHYEAIRDEAQSDFQNLFVKAFLPAYEQQLERLRRDRATPTPK